MAHSKSAKKSIVLSEEQRKRNRSINRSLKTSIGNAERLIDSGEKEPASEAVRKASISLDKAAQKQIIHWKNAARRKSQLMKKFNTAFPAA